MQRQIRLSPSDEGLTRCRCTMGQSAYAAAILLASLSASCASVRGVQAIQGPPLRLFRRQHLQHPAHAAPIPARASALGMQLSADAPSHQAH